MLPLTPSSRRYPWGSPTALPRALGMEPDGRAMAEAWFGAYPTAPSIVEAPDGVRTLTDWVEADPAGVLGADVVARFGPRLPFLLKLIAADSPLSLQVHPDAERAAAGYAAQQLAGVPVDAPNRVFPDPHHKPELLYALTAVEAVCGFRAPRRAAEVLDGLDAPLARRLRSMLIAEPDGRGLAAAFRFLVDPDTRPGSEAVIEVVTACTQRLWDGSPSPRADRTAVVLGEEHPGDPGAVASLLLNPVSLRAGEALYVPVGTVHAYLSGLAVEVMAASDNELRAGLTTKHTDPRALLEAVSWTVGPPTRVAPELFHGATKVFYAPVDDFELSVTHVADEATHPLPGRGPRVLVVLDGLLTLRGASGGVTLGRGQSVFASVADGLIEVAGSGTLVQATVP